MRLRQRWVEVQRYVAVVWGRVHPELGPLQPASMSDMPVDEETTSHSPLETHRQKPQISAQAEQGAAHRVEMLLVLVCG